MPAPTNIQSGIAQLYGVSGAATLAIFANLTFAPQSLKLAHKCSIKAVTDNYGNDLGLTSVNEMVEGTLEFEVIADTHAHAVASAVFQAPLTKVTLGSFEIGFCNGDWGYLGDGGMDASRENVVKYTLPLRKYVNATQNAAMWVTPA